MPKNGPYHESKTGIVTKEVQLSTSKDLGKGERGGCSEGSGARGGMGRRAMNVIATNVRG